MATNIVLLSGGIDSATLAASLAEQDQPGRGLFVDYGQAASGEEKAAAEAIAAYYDMPLQALRFEGLSFGSGEVRGRNAFLLHAALLALPRRSAVLMIGIHGGTTYVDCGEAFLGIHTQSFDLHTRGEVQIAAPFVSMSKGDVLQLAQHLDVPVHLTYSCEHGGAPCGECLSCLDRAHLSAIA